jgi:hypothetical protein
MLRVMVEKFYGLSALSCFLKGALQANFNGVRLSRELFSFRPRAELADGIQTVVGDHCSVAGANAPALRHRIVQVFVLSDGNT